MKKRIMTMAAALMLAFSAPAQVFMLNENESQRDGSETPDFNINNPNDFGQGSDYYEYAPLGSGALLLAGLAGAYLLGKKKKK